MAPLECFGFERARPSLLSSRLAEPAGEEPVTDDALRRYAEKLTGLAEAEVPTIDTTSSEIAVRQTVLRTVLIEPVLLALRRLAHEHVSSRTLRRRR